MLLESIASPAAAVCEHIHINNLWCPKHHFLNSFLQMENELLCHENLISLLSSDEDSLNSFSFDPLTAGKVNFSSPVEYT